MSSVDIGQMQQVAVAAYEDRWPKTVISGLSRTGDNFEAVIPKYGFIDDADWSMVYSAYNLYSDGRREAVEQHYIDSHNAMLSSRNELEQLACASVAETQNAMFDRIKREAHERRERENAVGDGNAVRDWYHERDVAACFATPLPHEVPLLAGPRPGMER